MCFSYWKHPITNDTQVRAVPSDEMAFSALHIQPLLMSGYVLKECVYIPQNLYEKLCEQR